MTTRWLYSYSSTLRSIYVLRFLLFSGGAAVAGGVIQRLATQSDRVGWGLLLGLIAGMVLFRGQLAQVRAPSLALSREALYLVQRKQAVTLPWNTVSGVSIDGPRVVVQLSKTLETPGGAPADQIQLEAKRFGAAPTTLHNALSTALLGEEARRTLPADDRVRSLLSIQG
ncbi:MAG: hypothetical protein ACT4TC_21545 [Myxococcaceae bacterium]